jgi:hypothetical protein
MTTLNKEISSRNLLIEMYQREEDQLSVQLIQHFELKQTQETEKKAKAAKENEKHKFTNINKDIERQTPLGFF